MGSVILDSVTKEGLSNVVICGQKPEWSEQDEYPGKEHHGQRELHAQGPWGGAWMCDPRTAGSQWNWSVKSKWKDMRSETGQEPNPEGPVGLGTNLRFTL